MAALPVVFAAMVAGSAAEGKAVAFDRLIALGVPRFGVTSVGEFCRRTVDPPPEVGAACNVGLAPPVVLTTTAPVGGATPFNLATPGFG